MKKKVMFFGVFDGYHDGHKFYLDFSKKLGDAVIIVARDAVVKQLKNKVPKFSELKRVETIRQNYPNAVVVLGDQNQGTYDVIKKNKPDLICLGYDQHVLKNDLENKILSGAISKIEIMQIGELFLD